NPSASAVGCSGSCRPVYTQRPRCSTNEPNVRGRTGPTTNAGAMVTDADSMGDVLLGMVGAGRAGDLLPGLVLQVGLRLVERLLGRCAVLVDLVESDGAERVVDGRPARVGERVEVPDAVLDLVEDVEHVRLEVLVELVLGVLGDLLVLPHGHVHRVEAEDLPDGDVRL